MPNMFDFLVTLALGIFIGSTATIAIAYSLEQTYARKLREKQLRRMPPPVPGTGLSSMRVGPNPFETPTQLFNQEVD